MNLKQFIPMKRLPLTNLRIDLLISEFNKLLIALSVIRVSNNYFILNKKCPHSRGHSKLSFSGSVIKEELPM